MTNLNKGRFKCADEAQAVCMVVNGLWGKSPIFNNKQEMYESHFEFVANALHKARLIHGSIYDEHGRIEDKDVAHTIAAEVCKFKGIDIEYVCNMFIRPVSMALLERGETRGTIFY